MIQTDIEDFVSIYKTIYPQKKFVYMSTPITTGPRFIEWYKKVGKDYTDKTMYNYQHRVSVIKFNEVDAASKAENLVDKLDAIVINPAEFKIKLSQREFLKFWTKFIIEHVSAVVLSDGWAYSKGCLNELLVAEQNYVPYTNFKLQPMNGQDAVKEIKCAIEVLKGLDLDYSVQEQIMKVIINEDKSYVP